MCRVECLYIAGTASLSGSLSIIPGIKVPNPWGKQWNAARRIVICDNYMFPTDFFLRNLFPL